MAGAGGQTLSEMQRTLHVTQSDDAYHPALSKLMRTLGLERGATAAAAVAGVRLAVANRLWVADKFELLPAYTKRTEGYYAARAERCHFATNAEGERVRGASRHQGPGAPG